MKHWKNLDLPSAGWVPPAQVALLWGPALEKRLAHGRAQRAMLKTTNMGKTHAVPSTFGRSRRHACGILPWKVYGTDWHWMRVSCSVFQWQYTLMGKQWCFQHVSTVKLHPHIQRNQFQDIRCAAIRWLPKRNAAKVCSTRGAFSACGTWMPPVKVVNDFPLQNSVEFGDFPLPRLTTRG